MKRLLLLDPDAIQSGVWKTNKAAGLLWQEGNNVVFRNNGVEKTGGATLILGSGDQARDFAQAYVSASGAKRIYVTTDTAVVLYELIAGVWSAGTLYSWATSVQYGDLETWGTWLVMTNGVDPVKVWKNGVATANLAGVPFTKARILKRKTPFLLAFNTDNMGDSAVEWSSESNIEVWTPGTGRAGNMVLRDLESEIVSVEDLGDRLAVYSRNSLVIGSFVGGTNVFGWKRAIKGIGAISRRSVVGLDPFNYGLTQDGIFKTDGVSFQWVDDPAMTKYIKDTADFSKAALFWGMADNTLKSVNFFFLTSDNLWRSVHYYPEKGFFTKGDLQLCAGQAKEVFDWPIVSSESGLVGSWQTADTNYGVPVPYSLKTKPLDFGERSINKLVQMVRVDGVWNAANRLKVQVMEDPEAPGTTVYDQPLVQKNYFEYEAPYFTLEFYGSAPFSMNAVEIFGQAGGPAL